jgi:hypothetical protein
MRRETYEEKEVKQIEKVAVSKSVTCNKCGTVRELKNEGNWYETDEDMFASDVHNVSLGFGYGSKFDMESWNFDLCDDCLESVVRSFKYPPDGFKEDGYSVISDEEERQKVFEYFKETGEWNEFKFKSYEELVKFAGFYDVDYINELIKEMYPDKPLVSIYDEE